MVRKMGVYFDVIASAAVQKMNIHSVLITFSSFPDFQKGILGLETCGQLATNNKLILVSRYSLFPNGMAHRV